MHKPFQALRELRYHATLNNAVLGVALFIAAGWVWGSVDALGRNYKYQQQVDSARAEVELIGLQNQNLQAEQSYLGSDEYLELAARAKLNKALPGEKLLMLPASTATSDSTTGVSVSAPVQSNFSQWMDFLFGKHSDSSSEG